jgi:hypothetical protein
MGLTLYCETGRLGMSEEAICDGALNTYVPKKLYNPCSSTFCPVNKGRK